MYWNESVRFVDNSNVYADEDIEIAGVFADLDFQEGDLVLKDHMLFGVQHSSNKVQFIYDHSNLLLHLLNGLHGFLTVSYTFDVAA